MPSNRMTGATARPNETTLKQAPFDERFVLSLALFILSQVLVYLCIYIFHMKIPFNAYNYQYNGMHYLRDPRIDGGPFNFLRALGPFDGQWYLKIADAGYAAPLGDYGRYPDARLTGTLSYAFFPLYPLILSAVNNLFHPIELSAFVLTNVLLVCNFTSLYYVVSRLFGRDVALRSIFLLFLFPFSIFFRSYFTEGLFLLLLIWFGYFLITKRWMCACALLALLCVTRPNGIMMGAIFLYYLLKSVRKADIRLSTAALIAPYAALPFLAWCGFCLLQRQDPLYWAHVQSQWFQSTAIYYPLQHNISTILSFFQLPLHSFHKSKIDVSAIFLTLLLLLLSWTFLPRQLWLISFLLWITPLFTKDPQSYTRFQTVSFPLFVYLGAHIKGREYLLLCGLFLSLLLAVALYFVNWDWIG